MPKAQAPVQAGADGTSGRPPVIVAVIGATATGKSDLALDLAEQLGGEVVNADAMQLYRGMDIGTAKLPIPERRGIAHHQLDVLAVTQEASLARYQLAARADLRAIAARGNRPVLVGGSGLYIRAALDRLEIPPTDPVVRSRLEAEASEVGGDALHARLLTADPSAGAAILPGNLRRVIRALEVIELTGRPFSATMPKREFLSATVMLGLLVDRMVLAQRIDERVERMWAAGLLHETQKLLAHGLREGVTASRAIGYSQAVGVVDGEIDEETARHDTALATRRYARRQESWFRPDPRIVWLDALAPDLAARARAVVHEADAARPRGIPENG